MRYRSDEEDSGRWDGFPFRDGDIVISTRSKSGTTWMQMICALLIFQTPELPAKLSALSPWLDWLVRPRDEVYAELAAQQHRRFIKTHTPLDGIPISEKATYIVVARHPLDMAVSLFHQSRNLNRARIAELTGATPPAASPSAPSPSPAPPSAASSSAAAPPSSAAPPSPADSPTAAAEPASLDAVAAPTGAAEPQSAGESATPVAGGEAADPASDDERTRASLLRWIDRDVTPAEAMDSLPGVMWHLSDAWRRAAAGENVLLVHYADLSADLEGQMRKIADRLAIQVPDEKWPTLVEAAHFDQMRARATELAPDPAGVLKDTGAFFRRGSSGAGRELLSEAEFKHYLDRAAQLAPPDLLAWLHR